MWKTSHYENIYTVANCWCLRIVVSHTSHYGPAGLSFHGLATGT